MAFQCCQSPNFQTSYKIHDDNSRPHVQGGEVERLACWPWLWMLYIQPRKTRMTLENHHFQKEIRLQIVGFPASNVSFGPGCTGWNQVPGLFLDFFKEAMKIPSGSHPDFMVHVMFGFWGLLRRRFLHPETTVFQHFETSFFDHPCRK